MPQLPTYDPKNSACPKCGSYDVRPPVWHSAPEIREGRLGPLAEPRCVAGLRIMEEHLHRVCDRCLYEWGERPLDSPEPEAEVELAMPAAEAAQAIGEFSQQADAVARTAAHMLRRYIGSTERLQQQQDPDTRYARMTAPQPTDAGRQDWNLGDEAHMAHIGKHHQGTVSGTVRDGGITRVTALSVTEKDVSGVFDTAHAAVWRPEDCPYCTPKKQRPRWREGDPIHVQPINSGGAQGHRIGTVQMVGPNGAPERIDWQDQAGSSSLRDFLFWRPSDCPWCHGEPIAQRTAPTPRAPQVTAKETPIAWPQDGDQVHVRWHPIEGNRRHVIGTVKSRDVVQLGDGMRPRISVQTDGDPEPMHRSLYVLEGSAAGPTAYRPEECPECQEAASADQERETLIEALAAYAHEAWSGWMRYLFDQSTIVRIPYPEIFSVLNGNGNYVGDSCLIPATLVVRWTRQMQTAYAELPEEEKASDRDEARKILAIMEASHQQQQQQQGAQS